MVRVDARLRIVAVFFIWAPASLVEEHEEDVALLLGLDIVQPPIQIAELQQALWHKVILDALVLEVSVHCFYQLEVGKCEADELIWRLVLIQCNHKWTVKPVVAKKLELLCVVIPCQCLL